MKQTKAQVMMKKTSPWLDTVPDIQKFGALATDAETDILVIGGGIVGILTAYQLSQSHRVMLLEKNHIATGDTGLTTGFLTRVPETSLAGTREKYSEEFVKRLFAEGRDAQQYIFSLIREKNIACDFSKCKTYFGAYEAHDTTLRDEWDAIKNADPAAAWNAKFPCTQAIEFDEEGKFHSRKFLYGLLGTKNKNLEIHEETEAAEMEITDSEIKIAAGKHLIRAKKIVIAAGMPVSAFPELQSLVTPKLTYVIGIRYQSGAPISEDLFWDTFDPYFYYRRIDADTVIVGGCDHRVGEKILEPFQKLQEFAEKYFKQKGEVVYQWSGSIFTTKDGIPYAFAHPEFSEKVFVATGLGGNGLVFGTCMSRTLVRLINRERESASELFSYTRTGVSIERHVGRAISPKVKKWLKVGTIDDFNSSQMLCAKANGTDLALFKVGENIYALARNCTHAGGSLCEGDLTGTTIQCPLHGAKFDVVTGKVLGPPATRPARRYETRITDGKIIEVEIETQAQIPSETRESSSQTLESSSSADHPNTKNLFIFTLFSLLFWAAQFAYQYFTQVERDLPGALIRSFSFTGATLISCALITSSIFKWHPALSVHWRIRRYFGVAGFTFIALHVLAVEKFIFDWDVLAGYTSLNPLENPIIFGSIAFTILFLMAATSSDYAVEKLGASRWKFLHRFVYIAYLASILHFIQMNPPSLKSLPGYVLLTLTSLALLGQLFWYIETVCRRGFRRLGTWIGAAIIILYIAGIYFYVHNIF